MIPVSAEKEKALIDALRTGKPAAKRSFYEQFHRYLAAVCARYVSDDDLGDEIANAVEAHVDAGDSEYTDFIDDVMTLMGVEWEFVPCRSFVL